MRNYLNIIYVEVRLSLCVSISFSGFSYMFYVRVLVFMSVCLHAPSLSAFLEVCKSVSQFV